MEDVLIRLSDEGKISLFDARDNFIASFKNGKWVNDLLFSDYELEEFTIVEDEAEIGRILAEARAALNSPYKAVLDNRAKSA